MRTHFRVPVQYRQDLHLKSNTVSFSLLPNAIKMKLTLKGHLPNVISPNSYNPRPLKLRVGTPNIVSLVSRLTPMAITSSPPLRQPAWNNVQRSTPSRQKHPASGPTIPIAPDPQSSLLLTLVYRTFPHQYQFLPFHPISNSHPHLHVMYFRTRLWYIGCNRFFHPILIRTKKYLRI